MRQGIRQNITPYLASFDDMIKCDGNVKFISCYEANRKTYTRKEINIFNRWKPQIMKITSHVTFYANILLLVKVIIGDLKKGKGFNIQFANYPLCIF